MTKKKKILFAVFILVVIVGVAEMGFDYFFSSLSETSVSERRTLDVYQNKPWADQYFKDMFECAEQRAASRAAGHGSYSRYLLSDLTISCETEYINYDGENLTRKTSNPEISSVTENAKVYGVGIFGGSTVMGLGTIDELTIPSHFSKFANEDANGRGVYYLVDNYGVSSYTYTQSLIKLIFLLREGKKFDYVVFYNGTNDIDNAYDAGEAGALIGEKALRAALEGSSFSDKVKGFVKNQINTCGICRAVVVVSRNTPFLRDNVTPYLLELRRAVLFREGDNIKSGDELERFAEEIGDYYIESHEILDALSRAYGFGYAEFWQPALIYGGEPIGDERRLFSSDARLTDEKLKTLYNLTRERVVSAGLENFYDISDALDDRESAYYVDAVHISGEGNGDVARKMLELVGDKLPK